MNAITIVPINKENWEEAVKIAVTEVQRVCVPSVTESLAYAYIKPWDEELDPYLLYLGPLLIGFFYISYSPDSMDNYWIGGFQIDQAYQSKGYGRQSLQQIISFIRNTHQKCEVLSLTVEANNEVAIKLYEDFGFICHHQENSDGEVIFKLPLARQ